MAQLVIVTTWSHLTVVIIIMGVRARMLSHLKVINFGLSVFFQPGDRFSDIVGSPYYMAPEVLKRNYGPEIDVWSAGVILYILLSGVSPFFAETEQGVAQAILRGEINFERDPGLRVSEDAKSLLRQMLERDPKRRVTAQRVLGMQGWVMWDQKIGRSRGFGFVSFRN